MRRSVVIFAAALFTLAAAPAFAQDVYPQSRVVDYSDLNVDNPHGAHVLVRRIERASETVCDDRAGAMPAQQRGQVDVCKAVSTADAVDDVDNPMVTAQYYRHHRGGTVVVTEDDQYAPYDDSGSGY